MGCPAGEGCGTFGHEGLGCRGGLDGEEEEEALSGRAGFVKGCGNEELSRAYGTEDGYEWLRGEGCHVQLSDRMAQRKTAWNQIWIITVIKAVLNRSSELQRSISV